MLTDVNGILVGQAQRLGEGWATGVTVVVPPPGTVAAVDVRGGGPGTHETDALAVGTLVQHADAVVLCGGSAFGLVAAHGVQRWCEEQGRGFAAGVRPDGSPLLVPVVPAAAIFDLGRGGDPDLRPDAELGFEAAQAARGGAFARGQVGAGTGARTSAGAAPGGVGTATIRLDGGVLVSALVVLNAAGRVLAEPLAEAETPADAEVRAEAGRPPLNTTLAVVATNAQLDRGACRRMAGAGHDGLARAIRPIHTLMDGDTVFGLATGELSARVADASAAEAGWPGAQELLGLVAVQAAAADAVQAAVLDAWEQASAPA
ncbi:MAG: P1 family peptidase [Actinomycetales bacterium]